MKGSIFRRWRLLGAFLAASTVSAFAAGPQFVEKSVKAAMVMADNDNEKLSVIVEGWNDLSTIRELLGGSAELDLKLVNGVSATVKVGKLRELLENEEVKAVYENRRVSLIEPVAEAEEARVGRSINVPRESQMLPHEEKAAGMTYGLRLIKAPQAVDFVRKFREAVKQKLGVDLPKPRVGVVDTGIDGHHENFKGMVYAWEDLSYDFSPEARDDHGHGSHVAGTIAGGTNPEGIQFGVVPQDLTSMAIARGLNPYGMDAWLISSLAWMADPDGNPETDDGVQVINNSWGSSSRRPLYDRLVTALTEAGITCVFAAGNSGPSDGTVGGPGHLPNVLTVGAVDHRKRIAPFSSRGDRIRNKAEIWVKPDVCAPGVSVLSVGPKNTWQRWPGTSMASPHVTGVVALMKAVNPHLKPRDIKLILEQTAQDLGPEGKDEAYGSGLVDAFAAVQRAAELFGGGTLEPSTPEELIAQARQFLKHRRTQYAVENLLKVIQEFPNLATETKIEAGYLMGEGYRELGNYKGAVESYKGVIMFDPQGPYAPKAEYWIAWCYLNATGGSRVAHLNKGSQLFEAFLATHTSHEWVDLAGLELARAYLQLRKRMEALAVLQKVLELKPNTPHKITIMQMVEEIQTEDDQLLEF